MNTTVETLAPKKRKGRENAWTPSIDNENNIQFILVGVPPWQKYECVWQNYMLGGHEKWVESNTYRGRLEDLLLHKTEGLF